MKSRSVTTTSCGTRLAPVVLLNAPVLTSFGNFEHLPVSVDECRRLVAARGFVSAIGHAPTALLLSQLLNIACPANRVTYRQTPGEEAIVLRLSNRLPEGVVLQSVAELEQVGYSFSLLRSLLQQQRSLPASLPSSPATRFPPTIPASTIAT